MTKNPVILTQFSSNNLHVLYLYLERIIDLDYKFFTKDTLVSMVTAGDSLCKNITEGTELLSLST